MRTTFPATFSLKMELTMKRKDFKNKKGGKKKQSEKKVKGGTIMFNSMWIRSTMVGVTKFDQREKKKNLKTEIKMEEF